MDRATDRLANLLHVSPRAFLHDSLRLGRRIWESGFRPKHVVSIWRGGTPVGLGVDAFFRTRGLFLNHTTIATESYRGMRQRADVTVKGLEHLLEVVCREDGLLLVDDVLDSGRTIQRIVQILKERARANCPGDIRLATVHRKPEGRACGIPWIGLTDLPEDTWIVYPHELAELIRDEDPEERDLQAKDPDLWRLLQEGAPGPEPWGTDQPVLTPAPDELLRDAVRLGLRVAQDDSFQPDFLVALWPGGIHAGLPVHEVFRYRERKGLGPRAPDHVSLNTRATRFSYRSDILGLHYLAERIGRRDQVLIVDTTFRSGQVVNDALMHLKEALRRNLDLDRVRVAAVYYNPADRSTWTVPPVVNQPHYHVKQVSQEVVYPQSLHRLADPRAHLLQVDRRLHEIVYGAGVPDSG